jgi:hypothetical protein
MVDLGITTLPPAPLREQIRVVVEAIAIGLNG